MKKWATLLIIIFVFTLGLAAGKTFVSLAHPMRYKSVIKENASKFNLTPALVSSVINVESGFNKNAKSNKNALGLMQIKLSTANYLINYYRLGTIITEQDLLTAEANITFGCMYLQYLSKKFNTLTEVLAAYNAGETNVRGWLKDINYSLDGKTLIKIPYKETDNYVKKVEKNLKFYKKCYKN